MNDSALETEFRKTIRTREFNRAENSSALKRRDSMRRDLEHDNRDSDDSCREGSRAGSLEPRNGDDSS
ncbi:hypothetical protein SARC_06329 [Sphaeroforma arctica JP610]|uniref:Uncharacterized protein n=1 Tax=Sphaeroforma arctica JP610 TaxID=667725 RepID=A0A0L0FZE8_9EUKA|nr:hypothetical protein SARC_06329 [Sphaeroforma arctica JP610]KNC81343.1 hypothetical protein SARC_06329 [Sphaeroforma arctica JP610]|eukprot:XP_014155245.1 hypothetical protein SARC_06329 [Sphaeroforma arctica JP610]